MAALLNLPCGLANVKHFFTDTTNRSSNNTANAHTHMHGNETWMSACTCSYSICLCAVLVSVDVPLSLFLARSVPHISPLSQWHSSNLSKPGNSWLHKRSDRCRLTVLYLQGYLCDCLCVLSICFCVCWDKPIYGSFFCYNHYAASEGTNHAAKWEFHLLLFILSIWLYAVWIRGERDAFILVQTGCSKGFLEQLTESGFFSW